MGTRWRRGLLTATVGVAVLSGCGTVAVPSDGPNSPVVSQVVLGDGRSPAPSITGVVPAEPTMYRGGPGRTGEMAGPGPTTVPVALWTVDTGAPVSSSAAVSGGVAYFGVGDGRIWAVSVDSGHVLWRSAASAPMQSSPAIAGDLVLAVDTDGVLLAVHRQTGEEAWRAAAVASELSSPLVTGNLAVVGGSDGSIHAFDLSDGAERWTAGTGGVVVHSVAEEAGLLYAGSRDGSFYAFDAATGARRWAVPLAADHFATAAVKAGVVYAVATAPTGGHSLVVALDASTGAERWRFVAPEEALYPPATDGRRVLVGSTFGALFALDAVTGEVDWRANLGGDLSGSPVISGDVVFVVDGLGRVSIAVDLATGREIWRAQVDGAVYAPTVIDGRLIVGTSAGTLEALGPGGLASATSSPIAASPSALVQPADQWLASLEAPGGLQTPSGVALDPDGNLWVVEGGRDAFAIFGQDGAFRERWGGSGSDPGSFDFHRLEYQPYGGIAFLPDGGFVVADSANHRVQVFDRGRRPVASWGTFGRANGQFADPISVAVGPDGLVYVCDDQRDDIQVFKRDGRYRRTIGSHGTGDGQLSFTGGIEVDSTRVLVADFGNDRVTVFRTDGQSAGSLLDGRFRQPGDISTLEDGSFVMVAYATRRIVHLAADGTLIADWPTHDGWFPLSVQPLRDGRVAVTESAEDGPTTHGRVAIYALDPGAP